MSVRKLSAVAVALAMTISILALSQGRAEASTLGGWAAPALDNPITVELRPGNQNVRLDASRDYILKVNQTLTDAGGVVIAGGRNVVLQGGEIRVPNVADATQRRGLFLKEQRGTIHIEGLHIGGENLAEGINLDERYGATVQLRNISFDTVRGTQAGNHADLIQTWAGPKTLRVDGLEGSTNYQGMFLLPHQLFPEAETTGWEMRNVKVGATADAGYGFWKEDALEVALSNVNFNRDGGSTWKSFWPNAQAWAGASFGLPSSSVLAGVPGLSYLASLVPPVTTPVTTTPPATTAPTTTPPTTTAPVTTPPTTTAPVVSPPVTSAPTTTPPTNPPTTAPATKPGAPAPSSSAPASKGYWLVASDGGVFSYGNARFHGSTGGMKLNQAITGMAAAPNGDGYWLVASDGGIFAFGDAAFFGSTGGMKLNKPITGMAATPTGEGYWLVASDGGIFAFGDAKFFGSTGGMKLNQPIAGMASTPSGNGYWLVASDGGIFAFGDASFFGSTGGMKLNEPITGMAAAPNGEGYWLVARDGGIFAFGRAGFFGSAAGIASGTVTGIRVSGTGNGYSLDAANGGVFAFGDSPFHGSPAGALNAPIVGSATL